MLLLEYTHHNIKKSSKTAVFGNIYIIFSRFPDAGV